jgi:uncharacterized protein (DUF885 family)
VSRVYELADRYVSERAALDPVAATAQGVPGHDREMTDYSPDGIAARADHTRATLTALRHTTIEDERDRRASALMTERLEIELALVEAGEEERDLRIIGSPVQSIRSVFDLMPHASVDDWTTIADRLEQVPAAISGFTRTLSEALDRGNTAAQRQAIECAKQAATWGGAGEVAPFFAGYVAGAAADISPQVRDRLDAGAAAATAAYAELDRFLRTEYAPRATTHDSAGQERYQLAARAWLGTEIDARETYAWGWSELHRIDAAMAVEAEKILPGGSVEDAKALLESDPARAIEGEDNLRNWIQELMDTTIAELDGTHFDIADPIKRVEAMIAPPGGAAAMYYTGPSEDFSRPGRTWYPTLGKTRFPLWGEVSIAYHEGVPGHHLQIGQVRYLSDRLSRFQRVVSVGGHAEGWALYAERLMDELGYLENPDFRLGQLRAQAMRAVRVIVDIGLHLELAIPADEDFHAGEVWTPELAREFAIARSHFPADFMASEIVRYLGWPAQAICYKVGERVWLESRDEVRRRQGPGFDLKAFHAAALDLGPMGLGQLREELARIP